MLWLMYSTFKDMKLENTTRAIRSAKENRGEEDGTLTNSSIDLKLSMLGTLMAAIEVGNVLRELPRVKR